MLENLKVENQFIFSTFMIYSLWGEILLKLIAMRPQNLIEERFSLSSKENDIIDMLLTKINANDLCYEINIDDYKKIYEQGKTNVYRDIKNAVDSFYIRIGNSEYIKAFSIRNGETGESITYPWFTKIHYRPNEGKIELEITTTLKTLLLDMKKRIYYNIQYTLNFKSIYSKRVYYYLKSFEDTGWRIDNFETLLNKLKCPESYQRYTDFRKYVLEPAQKEINKSDITFEFEPLKNGRKVTSIKFIISTNKVKNEICATKEEKIQPKKKDVTDPLEIQIKKVKEIIKSTVGNEISDRTAKTFYNKASRHKEYGNTPLELIKEVAEYSKTQNKDKGFVAWFNGTVEYYIKPIKQNKSKGNMSSTFNNFEQREYDFQELEKKLLGWD